MKQQFKPNKQTIATTMIVVAVMAITLFTTQVTIAQQQQPVRPLPPHLENILPPPANGSISPPLPTPPTLPGPPPTREQILHRGLIPDNIFQQCLALKTGHVPPADVFSANSRHIPLGFGKTIPLCAVLTQFADQAHPHGPPSLAR